MQSHTPAQQELSFEDAESGGELALPQTTYPATGGFMNAVTGGANSTLADMTSAVAHGLTYGTTAVAVGTAKGIARGLGHYLSGNNPYDDEEELVSDESSRPVSDESSRPHPKAKAKAKAHAQAQSQSSGSHESPFPYPFTEPPHAPAHFVDPAPFNGTGEHAISLLNEPRRRGVSNAAVKLAQETLNDPRYRGR